jgi:hypothetical protein
VLRLDCLDSADGVSTMRARYEAARVRMKTGGGNLIEFDSSKNPSEQPLNNPFSAMLATVLGQEFVFRLDGAGNVNNLSGGSAIVERMAGLLKNHPARKSTQEALSQSFGDEALTRTLGMLFAVVPQNSVKPGDAWEATSEWKIAQLGSVRATRKYVLRYFENVKGEGCARADFQAAPVFDVDPAGAQSQQYSVKTLAGEASGELLFSLEKGRARKVSSKQLLRTEWTPRIPETIPAESRPKIELKTLQQSLTTSTMLELLADGEGL